MQVVFMHMITPTAHGRGSFAGGGAAQWGPTCGTTNTSLSPGTVAPGGIGTVMVPSRRRDCYFADNKYPSILKQLLKREGMQQ